MVHKPGPCYTCDPESTQRRKTKENRVRELLEEHKIEIVSTDKSFTNDCGFRYRPDFLVDKGTFFLIIEVDEFAHLEGDYTPECEMIRMNNIIYGLGLPVKFIRYNPDNDNFTMDEKETRLIEEINKILEMNELDDIEIKYLFY